MFYSKAFLFVTFSPPFGLLTSTCDFSFEPFGVFGRLLKLGSLECPYASLVHWQITFPISFRRVGLISSKIITSITYLGSWAFKLPLSLF
jgi:hypothetical protein